jgi:transcription antitermination factor NusG
MPLRKRETDLYPVDLFSLTAGDWPWRVAHVRSRQEKGLARQLHTSGIPFYLPVAEKRALIGGRSRVSFLPLFPGYVFFRGGEEARRAALASRLVARLIPVSDPSLLEEELRQLRTLQEAGASLIPWESIVEGDAVRVQDGAFRGYSGIVLRETSRLRLLVSITMLSRSVAVEFPREALSRIAPPRTRDHGTRGAAA